MYNNYRAYDSSWSRSNGTRGTAAVKENGTMGRHSSASPPPVTVGDSKRRPLRDRLQNITSAMTWIKEELEGIKEQDKTLIEIFKKVQGDVKELNGFVASHRSSSSLQGTPVTVAPPQSLPPPPPSTSQQQVDTSLELDFDALDDDDELSDSGEHKTSSLSGTPSPPLPSHSRGLTDSGTSYSNLDTKSGQDGNRGNRTAKPPAPRAQPRPEPLREMPAPRSHHRPEPLREMPAPRSQPRPEPVREVKKENRLTVSKDSTPVSPTGTISISLGSLDLDFDLPSSFGLGTITEGRSLMNIPTTVSAATGNEQGRPAAGNGGTQRSGGGSVLQRSVSQQPLQAPPLSVAEKGRNLTYQPTKKAPPQIAPKPRRDSYKVTHPAPSSPNGAAQQRESHNAPAVAKVGRQTSEVVERLSPQQQARKEMMKSTPALFPSPPRTRRNTDSLPRNPSRVMTPLLPFQAQQELREAANKAKQEAGKKPTNGVIPQMSQGSPILLRKGAGAGQKQTSPPLSYRGAPANGSKQSPKHRNSPTTSRVYPPHLSPGGMKGSLSMTRLAPPSAQHRGQPEETSATMSRNSSMDSGIQYSEGETGAGATTGERASNTSTTTTDSVATTTSLASSTSEVKEVGAGKSQETPAPAKSEGDGKESGLGDFSDVFSVIANMGGGDSWFS